MGLFACDDCGVMENTALAGYRGWHARKVPLTDEETAEHPDWQLGDGKARCSECNPELGKWHGMFKRTFDLDGSELLNRSSDESMTET